MAGEGEPLSIPEVVKAQVQEHPSLVFVKMVADPKSLLDRNTIHGDPYLHNVKLFVAPTEPEYDPAKITKALNEVIEGLKPHAFKGHAAAAHLYSSWGHTTLHPAYLWLHEYMGTRVETSTWVFRPNNPNAKEVMAKAGIEEGQEYTKVEEKPMSRQVSTTFFPSVPLAHLAATYEEMSNFPGQEGRPYPFKNSLYAYHGVLDMKDVEQLKRDPRYVQEMADKTFVGYTVPGVVRPSGLQRWVNRLGFAPQG